MKARKAKPLAVTMWAAIRADGDVNTFWTRRDAVDHATTTEGIPSIDGPCTWPQAKAAGWRVVKVRVTEVRR